MESKVGSEQFVILHLSDAHFGKSGDGVDEDKVLKSLLEDVEKMHRDFGLTPNIIVFSGDLVQGCERKCDNTYCLKEEATLAACAINSQYKSARDFFNKLVSKAGIDAQMTPLVLVPGNHDVNRHRVDVDFSDARSQYTGAKVENLQKSPYSWNRTIHRQAQWMAFAKTVNNANCLSWDDEFNVPYGSIHHDGKQIGFVGLNTSWAAFDKNDRNKLWLGRNQFDKMLGKIESTDFKIAITHHPFSWLADAETTALKHQLESMTQLHFHGHEHSSWFNDSTGHLVVEGGAIYQDSERPNRYSWVVLDFNSQTGKIYARNYSNEGGTGWGPADVPGKIVEGVGIIKALFSNSPTKCVSTNTEKTGGIAPSSFTPKPFPKTTAELISTLQERFGLRWERGSYEIQNGRITHVFWPVSLRQPTAIHASQCFVAAGLIKTGCCINLFIDDLGKRTYDLDTFQEKLKSWIRKAGGDVNETSFRVRKYKDIANTYDSIKVATLDQLLTAEIYSSTILTIAKICSITDITAQDTNAFRKIVEDISKRRPRRLLTPAMTWTCLHALHNEEMDQPIITLGGNDEKVLWKTWRDRFPPPYAIGHLYIPELSGVHLADNMFNWSSREDISREFANAQATDKENSQNRMITWCVNNCVLVPDFIAGKVQRKFGEAAVASVNDLLRLENNEQSIFDFVMAVEEWVL